MKKRVDNIKSNMGISIIICCHNSAERLPNTLQHLIRQVVPNIIKWEVIVVDNASTDNTANVALDCWGAANPVQMQIVKEPQLGLSYARRAGILKSQYEIISFIDDDNWVCQDWIRIVWEIMSTTLSAAACGGISTPVSEIELPWWFDEYKLCYAVGAQTKQIGEVGNYSEALWGAGLSIRKSALDVLEKCGFEPLLTGRKGRQLTSGEDIEICLALRLQGWQLWYDPRLELKHYIPATRLTWNYLRRWHRGFGTSQVGLDPYEFVLNLKAGKTESGIVTENRWYIKALLAVKPLLRHLDLVLLSSREPAVYDYSTFWKKLWLETKLGYLIELLKMRNTYNRNIIRVNKMASTLSLSRQLLD